MSQERWIDELFPLLHSHEDNPICSAFGGDFVVRPDDLPTPTQASRDLQIQRRDQFVEYQRDTNVFGRECAMLQTTALILGVEDFALPTALPRRLSQSLIVVPHPHPNLLYPRNEIHTRLEQPSSPQGIFDQAVVISGFSPRITNRLEEIELRRRITNDPPREATYATVHLKDPFRQGKAMTYPIRITFLNNGRALATDQQGAIQGEFSSEILEAFHLKATLYDERETVTFSLAAGSLSINVHLGKYPIENYQSILALDVIQPIFGLEFEQNMFPLN